MSNGSGLPKYIPYSGHGATTFQAPVTGAFLFGFSLASDPHLVQDFVDITLNQAAPGEVEYRVLGGHVFLIFLYNNKATTPDHYGHESDLEAGFIVPLFEKQSLTIQPEKLVLWTPYLWIDSYFGMLGGREIWGFNKAMGTTTITADQAKPAAFNLNTKIFATLADTTLATPIDLLTVTSSPKKFVLGQQLSTDPARFIADILSKVASISAWKLIWDELVQLPAALLNIDSPVPLINLKQVRDAELTDRSRVKQLVEAYISVDGNFSTGEIANPGDYTATVARPDSHHIVEDLGLIPSTQGPPAAATFPIEYAFWVKMDWTLEPGVIIYDAFDDPCAGLVRAMFSGLRVLCPLR